VGAVAGGVAGGILVLVLLALGVLFLVRRREGGGGGIGGSGGRGVGASPASSTTVPPAAPANGLSETTVNESFDATVMGSKLHGDDGGESGSMRASAPESDEDELSI
jgi:hypothetical protein